jgi:formate dehydrogenase iron-sulfur subunit
MLACPFHIPRYQWESITPFVTKCDLCIDRVRDGKVPACVEACPHEALTFGERQAVLDVAHRQIRQSGHRYLPRIWGESEFGGTSILYLSDVDLNNMGFPPDESVPIPHITEPLISKTPHIGLGVLAGLCGLKWIIDRRIRIMNGEGIVPDLEEGTSKELKRVQ